MDRKVQASHLILSVHLGYRTWQLFSQAISLDSSLLSYINIKHANFLLPSLTTDEGKDLGPRYITAEDLALVRDESVEWVSRALRERGDVPVEENEVQVQATPAQAAEPGEEEEDQDEAMVTRRKMTIDQFIPSA